MTDTERQHLQALTDAAADLAVLVVQLAQQSPWPAGPKIEQAARVIHRRLDAMAAGTTRPPAA